MIVYRGDMWHLVRHIQDKGNPPPLIMITTNGYVKTNGRGVMGAGCAKQARDMFEDVDLALGQALEERGNIVTYLGTWNIDSYQYRLFSYPVKDHWRQKATNDLIIMGMQYIEGLTRMVPDVKIIVPLPGCGNGGRDWATEVQPMIAPHTNDRMIFVTN